MSRIILHSDLNGFYASVEMMLDPSLRGRPVAVCGSTEDRHGIVLAKSEAAKKAGIKTGMVNWEARQKCPGLIVLHPQYEQYLKYSKLTQEIYQRYTDKVEPFGMDECWLDVTGALGRFANGEDLAHDIRKTVKEELGLTVSIGVSFNKVFAKLGSDLKKPDAVTPVTEESFRTQIWPLPASELIYCGRATIKKLMSYGIYTIGDVAGVEPSFLQSIFGKNGLWLWAYANGEDHSPVAHMDFSSPVKSVGHGITCTADLRTPEQVWRVILHLSQDIGHRLRVHKLAATGVQLTVKDTDLAYRQHQAQLPTPTQSPMEVALLARQLFQRGYKWHSQVRAVTVRAINLVPADSPRQLLVWEDIGQRLRRERLDDAVEDIRSRFGKWAIYSASLAGDLKLPGITSHDIIMPGIMGN